MSETEELAVRVVETVSRSVKVRDVDVATEGWGWPAHDPERDAYESWLDAMDSIRKQVDLDANIGEAVATLVVDVETRLVRDWGLRAVWRKSMTNDYLAAKLANRDPDGLDMENDLPRVPR